MKKSILLAIISFLSLNLAAQENAELELYKSVFNTEKKMMIVEYMSLTEEESSLFWDVYNDYESERAELAKLRYELLKEYAEGYEIMNDESAADLLKKANQFHTQLNKLKVKYSKKMTKAIGAKKALQWMQFEEYLDRAIGLAIMESMPFVGEYN